MQKTETIPRRIPLIPLIAVIAVALAAFFTVLYATATWGISIKEDAAVYIQAAQRLVRGENLNLTHYPPFYPVLLWVTSVFTGDVSVGARWLHAVLFALTTLVIALLLRRTVPGATWLPLLGAILFVCSFDMSGVYLAAWSEAPFILFAYSGLFLLAWYLSRPRWWVLVLSGVFTALALVTRYAGLAVVATGGLVLLFLSSRSWRQKIIDGFLFGVVSALPLGLWLLKQEVTVGNATNRSLFFHLPDVSNIALGTSFSLRWLLPQRVVEALPFAAQVFLLGAVVIGLVVLYRRAGSSKQTLQGSAGDFKLPAILVIFIPVYLISLFVTVTLFDSAVRFNLRILSPMFPAALILVLYAVYSIFSAVRAVRWPRATVAVAAGIAVVYVGIYLMRSVPLLIHEHQEGSGYISLQARTSEGMRVIRDTPAQVPIYCNTPDVVYFAEGRRVLELPVRYNFVDRQPRPTFDAELQAMLEDLRTKKALIVYFDGNTDNDQLMVSPSKDLIDEMQIPLVVTRMADATIYKAP